MSSGVGGARRAAAALATAAAVAVAGDRAVGQAAARGHGSKSLTGARHVLRVRGRGGEREQHGARERDARDGGHFCLRKSERVCGAGPNRGRPFVVVQAGFVYCVGCGFSGCAARATSNRAAGCEGVDAGLGACEPADGRRTRLITIAAVAEQQRVELKARAFGGRWAPKLCCTLAFTAAPAQYSDRPSRLHCTLLICRIR